MPVSKYVKKYNKSIKGICNRAASIAKIRSKRKNLKYNINSEFLISIYPKNGICPILGYKMIPNQGKKLGQNKYSPTLDRINPRLGYTKNNVEWVCALANSMMTYAQGRDLIKFAKWINKRYGKKY